MAPPDLERRVVGRRRKRSPAGPARRTRLAFQVAPPLALSGLPAETLVGPVPKHRSSFPLCHNNPVIPHPSASSNATQIILRNSLWYGLELLSGLLGAFLVTIIMARAMWPEHLGYFLFISVLTNITVVVGALGFRMTTRKYMADSLNRGERGLPPSVYCASS